jgi:hypothetical protein
MQENNLNWRRDIAIVISNDAVHYGDLGWGGQDYAPYGADTGGYRKAVSHDMEIINRTLTGPISINKVREFTQYTVQDTNFRSYKWTWCGRYSVPFGLLTTFYLQQKLRTNPVKGELIGYNTSISQPFIPVADLKMGATAEATIRHWVGYTVIGYR